MSRVVRLPNHLGDAVMALPALAAWGDADVVVAGALAPLIELVAPGRVLPLERSTPGLARAARELRRRRYEDGLILTRSVSSALLFALGGVRRRRGHPAAGRPLLTDAVDPARIEGLHRASAFHVLATGDVPPAPPVPRVDVPAEQRARWRELVGDAVEAPVGLVPGSKASSRRWDPDRFAELAAALVARGHRVVVFGAGSERAITARVAAGGGTDLGGRTDLPLLAAGLAACRLVIGNDTGTAHLAAAVGTPTLSLWGAGDPAVTRPLGEGAELIRRADLPCVPCVLNTCPRRGAGTILPEAERECLRLLAVDDVLRRAVRALEAPAAAGSAEPAGRASAGQPAREPGTRA